MNAATATLIAVIAYMAIWFVLAWYLGRDEEDDKMKSLWFMVSMLWPVVWMFAIVAFIGSIFDKDERSLR